MKEVHLFIPGPLPGMNEMIADAKVRLRKGTLYDKKKKEWTQLIALFAKKLPKFQRVFIEFEWFEPNRRRDPDNIAAAKKFVLDGLVEAGIIPGDSWRYIAGWQDKFKVNKQKPGVLITIKETKNG